MGQYCEKTYAHPPLKQGRLQGVLLGCKQKRLDSYFCAEKRYCQDYKVDGTCNHEDGILLYLRVILTGTGIKLIWHTIGIKGAQKSSVMGLEFPPNLDVPVLEANHVWKLPIRPTIQLFLWKVIDSGLPLNSKSAKFKPGAMDCCDLSHDFTETRDHFFHSCFAKEL